MAQGGHNEFQLPRRQLRAELIALSVAITGAAIVGALDLGVRANASAPVEAVQLASDGPLLGAQDALDAAARQGLTGTLTSDRPAHSFAWDREIWRLDGEQRAIIDARTGEVLEVAF